MKKSFITSGPGLEVLNPEIYCRPAFSNFVVCLKKSKIFGFNLVHWGGSKAIGMEICNHARHLH